MVQLLTETWLGFPCCGSYFYMSWLIDFASRGIWKTVDNLTHKNKECFFGNLFRNNNWNTSKNIFTLSSKGCSQQFSQILWLILISHNYEIHMSYDWNSIHRGQIFFKMPHTLFPPPHTHTRRNDLSQISETDLGEHNWIIPIEKTSKKKKKKTFKINFLEYQICHFF